MQENILDFDLFLREKEKKTIPVRIMGEIYEIEAAIPALVPLKMARAERLRGQDRNTEYTRLVFEAADALFGEAQLDRFAGRLTAEDLVQLMQLCFERINGKEQAEGEELSDEQSRTSLPGRTGKK